MKYIHDEYGLTTFGLCLIILAFAGLMFLIALGCVAGINIAWIEGVETTVTGTIQLHQLKYSKFWNMEYTKVEMRTYSGDTHHVSLLGHVDLKFRETYTIKYVVQDYWGHIKLMNRAISIEEVSSCS